MQSRISRIGVLMGGASSEREISLKSGKAVTTALKAKGYDVAPIDISDDVRDTKTKLRKSGIGVAFIALHGKFGEDGTIQEILESLSIPYTGSGPEASRLGMNKVASREIFQSQGIPVPRHKLLHKLKPDEPGKLGYFPLVVKPVSHGSSIGLSVVSQEEELAKAIDLAYEYDHRVIIEEHIKGKEITIGVLDGRALPVIHIVPKSGHYNYEAKYKPGMTDYIVPAGIPKRAYQKAQEIGLLAHRALGCKSFSRVDCILNDKGEVVVLEVNTIPGFTQTSLLPKAALASGINFTELCVMVVEMAIKEGTVK